MSRSDDEFLQFIGILVCICGFPISLSQLIVGGEYFSQCPANRMMPIFNVIAGVFGIIAVIFIVMGLWISFVNKDTNNKVLVMVPLVVVMSIYTFFFFWYAYGGSLTSVDPTAKSRQSTYRNDTNTYCAEPIQKIIDAVVLMFWLAHLVPLLIFCAYICKG